MNHDEAVALVKENIKKDVLFKHIIAVEAIMKGLAEHLGKDIGKWGLVGLLHDLDFEKCSEDYKDHGLIAADLLQGKVDEEIIHAIKSHNFANTGVQPESDMDKALIAADAVSGLIVAAALMQPSKKLADVTAESIAKKFKKKDFARNCNRENMLYCEQIGIDKNKFFEISLRALQGIADELGL